ncbi:HEAT repeat domain-containing protein [Candidatus Poribacteria bacterium]|nr:HEAT repeat domain-containing protein [Candidatus Poribacteria bacterium]
MKKILDLIAQRYRIQKDAMQVLIDKGAQAVPLVIDSLGKNQFVNAQSDLIEILYRIGPKGLNLMTDALSAPDTPISVKRTLVQIIGRMNDPSAIPALESKRKSGDAGLTMEINIALYQLGKKDYGSEIIAGLSDRDVYARRAAAKAMSEINDSPTDEIIKALKDSDPQVRMYAAQALEKFPKKQATDSLIETLKTDSNEETKQAVTQALIVYGQQDLGKDLAARLIKALPAVNQPNDRLRIVHILKTDAYKQQIKDAPKEDNLVYNLWKYATQDEKNEMVKTELDRLLVELPEN